MRKLSFCLGNSRQAAAWRREEMDVEELWGRLEKPVRTSETMAQYSAMKKGEKDAVKDKGGFLAGTLKGTRRRKNEVVSRSMVTLDCDKMKPGAIDMFDLLISFFGFLYTTHSHSPAAPRARILIPLTRDVTPEEYNAIARYLADGIGMKMIDPCSFEINQLMYWPTASADGEYICRRYEGDWLDPDRFLAEHPAWKDCARLPLSPMEKEAAARERKKQEDPLGKEGLIGTFCRAFTPQECMRAFLSDVYEETASEDRWRYIPSESIPGVMVYDDKFVYSHHASDPAYGQLLNAFDLVRVHLFDDDDPKKSLSGMMEFAAAREEVQALSLQERRERAKEEFGDYEEEEEEEEAAKDEGEAKAKTDDGEWMKKLVWKPKSTQLENSLFNIQLILQNDRYAKNIVFNQLAGEMEIKGKVPWEHPARFWRDADDAQLICYVDDHYGSFSRNNYEVALAKTADDRKYHPIRDYFSALPEWDGVKRVDTLFIDYLGAEDNGYIRAVIRKTLCAAYMRVHDPGIKFDYMPVLNGPQGIGKSTFIANLGMEWFSDSLNLSDMNDKTAAEKLQGYWIIEIGELAGMKKADLDKVKAFISRTDDKYRASFGRHVTSHPRQCIFFGTTNSDNGYLRDITGNRRYWNVKVTGKCGKKPWDMTREVVDQIWAETAALVRDGESLYLPPELEMYAKEGQRAAMEQDDREGLVLTYLDMLLPENWDTMSLPQRQDYTRDPEGLTQPIGVRRRREVSNIEIWCECFCKSPEDMRAADSYAIAAIMAKLEGWTRSDARKPLRIYGRQRLYVRNG